VVIGEVVVVVIVGWVVATAGAMVASASLDAGLWPVVVSA
jgi:hypothetical protein